MDLVRIFESLDLAAIKAYVDEGEPETLHLDFKTVTGSNLDRGDDKASYSKALSGFANSDGGLIVWGVDCRKNGDGVDCAGDLKPIPDLARFVGRLRSLEGDMVLPGVDGVDHKAIDAGDGAGFAATIVPASDRPPHMARAAGRRYFKRNGESFYPMEHFDVADMFGRRAKPRLEIVTRRAGGLALPSGPLLPKIMLALRNTGRGLARYPIVSIRSEPPFIIRGIEKSAIHVPGLYVRGNRGRLGYRVFYGGADHVIHPGTELDFATIQKQDGSRWHERLEIVYELGADGVELREGRLDLGKQDYAGLVS